MTLHLYLTSHKATITLKKGEDVIDSSEFDVDNNLAHVIFPEIEELLRRNKVAPLSLLKMYSQAHEAGFTTERIGQVVANAYNFALQNKE